MSQPTEGEKKEFRYNIKKSLYMLYLFKRFPYVSLRLRVQNGISRLISALCVNCLISIPEYSRIRLHVQNGISRLIFALCINCLISILEYSRLNHLDVHLV